MATAAFEAPGGTLHVETTEDEGISGSRDVAEFGRAITGSDHFVRETTERGR